MTTYPTDRCLAKDLDSVAQRRRWAGSSSALTDDDLEGGMSWFAGALRTTNLLSRRIVVLDSQLLDGTFFLALGPSGVRRLLGLDPRQHLGLTVSVRSTCGDLRETLREMALGREPNEGLAGFEWSCVERWGVDPRVLAQRLEHVPSGPLSRASPEEVPIVLARCMQAAWLELPLSAGLEPPFAALCREWQRWTSAVADGRVDVEHGSATEDLSVAVSRVLVETLPELCELLERFPFGSDALAKRMAEIPQRSLVRREVSMARRSGLDPEIISRTVDWWDTAYFEGIAESRELTWVGFGLSNDRDGGTLGSRRREVAVTGELNRRLAVMPSVVYATTRFAVRDQVDLWLADPSLAHGRALAFAVLRVSASPDLRRERRVWFVQVGAAVTAVASAAAGAAADQLELGTIALMLAVVTGLLAAPADALFSLRAFRRGNLDTVLHLARR